MAERWRVGAAAVTVAAAITTLLSACGFLGGDGGATADTSPISTAPETVFAPPLTGDAPFRFVDVTARAGLAEPQALLREELPFTMNGGAAAADYDGDGFVDVYLTRRGFPNRLMRNRGDGTFEDVAAQAGVDAEGSDGTPVFADVDGDRDLDLLVTGIGETGQTRLFINEGAGKYVDEAEQRGILTDLVTSHGARRSLLYGATFSDVDLDGDLDLLVTQWFPDDSPHVAPRTRMFMNDGTGFFADRTKAMRLDELQSSAGFTPIFQKLDGDDYPDLLLSGDWKTARALRNVDGKKFEDMTKEWRVGAEYNAMGGVVTDLDGDGNIEWFVTSVNYPYAREFCPGRDTNARDEDWAGGVGCDGNRLYEWDGKRFRDVTDEFGVRSGYWGWGTTAPDFDLDGTPELAMTNGMEIAPNRYELNPQDPMERFVLTVRSSPNRLWHRGSDGGKWVDVAAATGFANTEQGKALIAFDMDNDGDLDVLQGNTVTAPTLYRNDTTTKKNWLRVRVTEPEARNGVGSTIEVTPVGGRTQRRWVHAGGTYMGAEPFAQTFGLGDATSAAVTVVWPDGKRQKVGPVEAGREVEVQRDAK